MIFHYNTFQFDVDAFVKSTSDTVEKGEKLNAALANINNPSSECKTSANELKARVSAMGIALKVRVSFDFGEF